ncbi:type IV pili twitching motility protein PilT, partial [Aeromonas hydrophila]
MNLDELLGQLVEKKGSDLFVTVGTPPTLKVNGHLLSLGGEALDKKAALTLVRETLSPEHFERYIRTREANYAIHRETLGRFRVSA